MTGGYAPRFQAVFLAQASSVKMALPCPSRQQVTQAVRRSTYNQSMKTKILLTVILSMVLVSCAPVSTSTPTETLVPTATRTVTPIPPTSTATTEPSLTPTPTEAAPKDGDTRTVTENGYTYAYRYSEEYGQGLREIANFPLVDFPHNNYVPIIMRVGEKVIGERSLLSLIHKDFTPADIPASGSVDLNNVTGVFSLQLRKRYFQGDTRPLNDIEKQIAIQHEMRGQGDDADHRQAYLPIIVSDGEEKFVKLSETTGILLNIIDPETMKRLGGDNIVTLHNGNITFYVEVYGVDQAGNELVRMAFDGSLGDIPTDTLREILFSIPGNFVDHKDQREQGFTLFARVLADLSAEVDPLVGTIGVDIIRTP